MPTRPDARTGDRQTPQPPADLLLRNLSAQHRQIIVATYFRRRTTREAARVLGLSPDAAKRRLYHAMRDLSDMLATGRPDRVAAPTRHRPLATAYEHRNAR